MRNLRPEWGACEMWRLRQSTLRWVPDFRYLLLRMRSRDNKGLLQKMQRWSWNKYLEGTALNRVPDKSRKLFSHFFYFWLFRKPVLIFWHHKKQEGYMKKIIILAAAVIACLSLMIISSPTKTEASGGLCFLCGSGSTCEQCPSPSGNDTSDDRKACESKGCKVSGTTSCSGAANINYCK